MSSPPYSPPYDISSNILQLVVSIGEQVGRLGLSEGGAPAPRLRRENRIKSIHASLAIENNTLSLEQVTALLAGKRVLGPLLEVQEVKNAFAAYESMNKWSPHSSEDLLSAHRLMMEGLVDHPGQYRSGGVGIAHGKKVVHLAPPAQRVPVLMKDLLDWLRRTDAHPLIAGCVFHYELEFIHPFADGNGRMGRLWQALILSNWKMDLAYLPVEDVIRRDQDGYYKALAASDGMGQSSPFIQFMLTALLKALEETAFTDQVTDQVKLLLLCLAGQTLGARECMGKLGLSHRPTFGKNYLKAALAAGLIERSIPEKPNSRLQKYRLTLKGRDCLQLIAD